MKSDREIIDDLKQLTEGLLFMSESDYPFETVYLEGKREISLQQLRELSGQPHDAPVEVRSLDEFFRGVGSELTLQDGQQVVVARDYQALSQYLKENLDDVKVYRVGQINIAVYIIGRTRRGNIAGLSTRVVET